MFVLTALGLGILAGALVLAYWDRIKRWLDTILAEKIEKVFGYGAKKRFHHAVSIADRVTGGIRNRIFVYVSGKQQSGYMKYEEKIIEDINTVERDIVDEINENGAIIQEYAYTEGGE